MEKTQVETSGCGLENNHYARERRVGAFTFGAVLVTYGVLYLIKIFWGGLTYSFLFRLWPIIFIMLGCEILFSLVDKGVKIKIDYASVILMFLLVGVSIVMGCFDYFLTMYPINW